MMTLIILIMMKISLSTMNAYSDGNSHLCSGHSQHSVAGGSSDVEFPVAGLS